MPMIVNTAAYHFVPVADADALAARLLERAQAHALRGTVLVADEGINLFLAGSRDGIDGFYAELKADARFAAMRVKYSYSRMQPFARLKAKDPAQGYATDFISLVMRDTSVSVSLSRDWPSSRSRASASRWRSMLTDTRSAA